MCVKKLGKESVPGALSELDPQLFGLPFLHPCFVHFPGYPTQRIEAVTSTSLLREGVLRVSFIYKHHLQVLWVALVNGNHKWCSIRDIRIFSCLPLHILFSCPVYVFICNMHLFVTPLWGTKPGSYKLFSCYAVMGTSLFWKPLRWNQPHYFSYDSRQIRISRRCYAPWPCWLFSIHSAHSVFFILFSVLQHIVFSTKLIFHKDNVPKLESAIFYKDAEAGPQLRKVLLCIVCAL